VGRGGGGGGFWGEARVPERPRVKSGLAQAGLVAGAAGGARKRRGCRGGLRLPRTRANPAPVQALDLRTLGAPPPLVKPRRGVLERRPSEGSDTRARSVLARCPAAPEERNRPVRLLVQ